MYGKRKYNQGTINGLLERLAYTYVRAITVVHANIRKANVKTVRTMDKILSVTKAGWIVSRAITWTLGHIQSVQNRVGTGIRTLPTYSRKIMRLLGHRVRLVIQRFVTKTSTVWVRKGTAKRPNLTYQRKTMSVLKRFGQVLRKQTNYVSHLFQKTVLRARVTFVRYTKHITHTFIRKGTGRRLDTNYVSPIAQKIRGGVAVLKQIILIGIFNIFHRIRVIFDQNSTITGGVNLDFNMYAGDTKTIIVNVVDGSNAPKVLTGANVKFVMKKKHEDSAVVSKSSGSGIVMRTNSFEINLVPADTVELMGSYIYECEVTDSVGYVATVARGTLTIKDTII